MKTTLVAKPRKRERAKPCVLKLDGDWPLVAGSSLLTWSCRGPASRNWRVRLDERGQSTIAATASAMPPLPRTSSLRQPSSARRDGNETSARHVSLLKDGIDARAQLARPQHARARLREVRREIVTGDIDQTAHVLVAIAEQLDDCAVDDLFARRRGCARATARPTDETTRLRRRALRRSATVMSRRLTCSSSWQITARWKSGSERIESRGQCDGRTEHPERPRPAVAGLQNVTRRHAELGFERGGDGRRRDSDALRLNRASRDDAAQ